MPPKGTRRSRTSQQFTQTVPVLILFRDAMGAAQVLRPDARGEAVFDVVGVTDHFFFVVERRDRNDGAEDFFAICAA